MGSRLQLKDLLYIIIIPNVQLKIAISDNSNTVFEVMYAIVE